jgi:hypothetical protein
VCVDSRDIATKLTLFVMQVMLVFLLMFSERFLNCSPPPHVSTIANAEPGIHGDRVTCIPVRDLYMELCMRV